MSFTTSTPVSFALTAGRVFAVRTKLNAGGIAKVYGATSNKEYSIPQAFAGTFGPYTEDKTVVVAALSGVIEYDFGATVSLPGYVYNSAISEHSGSAVSQYRAVEFVVSTAAAIPTLAFQGDGVFVKDENGATWPWNGASYGKPLTSNPATGVADSAAQAAIFAARSLTTNVFVQVNSFCTAQVGGTGSYSYDTQTDAGAITVGVGSGIAPDTVPIYMGGATKVRFIFPNTATVKVN